MGHGPARGEAGHDDSLHKLPAQSLNVLTTAVLLDRPSQRLGDKECTQPDAHRTTRLQFGLARHWRGFKVLGRARDASRAREVAGAAAAAVPTADEGRR